MWTRSRSHPPPGQCSAKGPRPGQSQPSSSQCPTPVPHIAMNLRFPLTPLFLLLPRPDLSPFSSGDAAFSSIPTQLLCRKLPPLSLSCPPRSRDLSACGSFPQPSSPPTATSQGQRPESPPGVTAVRREEAITEFTGFHSRGRNGMKGARGRGEISLLVGNRAALLTLAKTKTAQPVDKEPLVPTGSCLSSWTESSEERADTSPAVGQAKAR